MSSSLLICSELGRSRPTDPRVRCSPTAGRATRPRAACFHSLRETKKQFRCVVGKARDTSSHVSALSLGYVVSESALCLVVRRRRAGCPPNKVTPESLSAALAAAGPAGGLPRPALLAGTGGHRGGTSPPHLCGTPPVLALVAARAAPPCCPPSCAAPLDVSSSLFLCVRMAHAAHAPSSSAHLDGLTMARARRNGCNHARAEGGGLEDGVRPKTN